jgi:hypothetical protein
MTQITIDRAIVEQGLEALEGFAYHGKAAGWPETMTNLRAALAQQTEPETCTWHQDGDSDSGLYATSCGRYFNLEDGAPEDNEMSHCCYCGKRLVQELIAEETK